ncbi:aminoglycoside phosphotransferase family protein [Pseudodesulfovibrio sp. zrk46]|uniref:phosphotransferase family protein n=1 Tax=Pseudodesulfovibrio sp. zrk46 TaxID=2725288 RepID=UPI001FFCE216|nr:aminoglycoside phosphotransferase family protein [Pseudodesulfovibrio sp. zrk46]
MLSIEFMDTIEAITTFLETRKWVVLDDPEEHISFLAAGEYNENYRITVNEIYGDASHVFRINHDSQLGLEDQIEYEFAVLRALVRSGVTPRPFYCEPDPKLDGLGKGVLLMEYLPGRPLQYENDWREAARIFAKVHSQPVDHSLIVQANPILDIARESEGLIHRYPDHPMTKQKQLLLDYHAEITRLAEEAAEDFRGDPLVIANTEVNSHNFIIDDETGRGWLVDWEKAVVTSRFQDIGHFLVPTTTLWKTDFRFTDEGKKNFVAAYLDEAGLDMDLDTALRLTDLMERTILLRAMSWCFMAYYEYTRDDRALKNADTFARIEQYLGDMECFFAQKA